MADERNETEVLRRYRSAFDLYLRTGGRFRHDAGPDVEVKFNPWHDPDDGRFTFAGQGTRHDRGGTASSNASDHRLRQPSDKQLTPSTNKSPQDSSWQRASTQGGGGSVGGGGASGDGYWLNSKEVADLRRKHPGYEPTMAGRGETWDSVARRTHSTKAVLLKANGKVDGATLKPGDIVFVPARRGALALRAASNKTDATPPHSTTNLRVRVGAASKIDDNRHVKANGFEFVIDKGGRTLGVVGLLTTDRVTARRNRRAQAEAGGSDRMRSDDGGHFVAHRFNGPSDAFNHFAQDRNFNRSAYAQFENEMERARKSGKKVLFKVDVEYEGSSKRPASLRVAYYVDGRRHAKTFLNRSSKRK